MPLRVGRTQGAQQEKSTVSVSLQTNRKGYKMAIGSHQSHIMQKDEWLTPPDIIKALGPFDLDPCSPLNRPWDTAGYHYSLPQDDGLMLPWFDRVWLNPPYGSDLDKWMSRMAIHQNGTALIFARTETRAFFKHVWPVAKAVLFIEGRLHFYHVDGTRAPANSGAPSVLIAYGERDVIRLRESGIKGKLLTM